MDLGGVEGAYMTEDPECGCEGTTNITYNGTKCCPLMWGRNLHRSVERVIGGVVHRAESDSGHTVWIGLRTV